jgi:hypothetical protein
MLSSMPKERPPVQNNSGHVIATVLGEGIEPHYRFVTDISKGYVQFYVNGFDVPDVFALLFDADGPTLSGNYEAVFRRRQKALRMPACLNTLPRFNSLQP